jgi:glycine oxidase
MASRPDVLIIGGGIIGLAIAYYLSTNKKAASLKVMLLEKENSLVSHASGHNAGGISSAHLGQSAEVRSLARRTSELYLELSRSTGLDFDFRLNGSLELLPKDKLNPRFQGILQEFRDKELGKVELLSSPEQIKEKEPNLAIGRVQAALYYPEDAEGNPLKLGRCFSKICSEKGTDVKTETEVRGFNVRDQKIVTVSTDKSTMHPGVVIVAAGPWSGRIAKKLDLKVPVEPVKGHLITTRVSNKRIVNTFLFGPNYYVLQSADGALVVGGGEDQTGYDSTVIDSRAREAWTEMSSLVPYLTSLGQESVSACLRPFAADGLPIIGRSSKYTNLFFATGHFRNGFSLAPVTGKIISELVLEGECNMKIESFSPARFGA